MTWYKKWRPLASSAAELKGLWFTWTHWLLLSAIRILPLEEVATPWRLVNSPLFLPLVPGTRQERVKSEVSPEKLGKVWAAAIRKQEASTSFRSLHRDKYNVWCFPPSCFCSSHRSWRWGRLRWDSGFCAAECPRHCLLSWSLSSSGPGTSLVSSHHRRNLWTGWRRLQSWLLWLWKETPGNRRMCCYRLIKNMCNKYDIRLKNLLTPLAWHRQKIV